MADDKNTDFDPRWMAPSLLTTPEKTETGASLLDIPKAVGVGAGELAQQAISTGRYGLAKAGFNNAAEAARGVGELAGAGTEALRGSITPGGRRAMDAQLIPDADHASVFESPVSTMAMKAAGAAAPVAASMALPEARAAQAIGGAALQTGQNIDSTYRAADAATQNSDQSQQVVDQALTPKSLAAGAAAGALAGGVLGPMFHGSGGANGVADTAKRVGTGALEGGAAMGVAGAQGDVSQQNVEQAIDPSLPYNLKRTLKAGVNAGFEGAALGGAAAGVTGNSGRSATKYDKGATPDAVAGATPAQAKPLMLPSPLSPDVAQEAALASGRDAPSVINQGAGQQPLGLPGPAPKQAIPLPEGFAGRMDRPPDYNDPTILDAMAQRQNGEQAPTPNPASSDQPLPPDMAQRFQRSNIENTQRPPLQALPAPEAKRSVPFPDNYTGSTERAPEYNDPAILDTLKQNQRPPLEPLPEPGNEAPAGVSSDTPLPAGVNPDVMATIQKAAKPGVGSKGEEAIAKSKSRKEPTPEPVKEATTEASQEPVRESRVLRDVSDEAVARDQSIQEENNATVRENLQGMEPKPEAGSGAGHRTKAEKEARANNNAVADKVVEKFKPKENETAGQRKDRAAQMVKTALEEGWKKPGTVKDTNLADHGHSPASMLLTEAQRLISKSKNASDTHFDMSERLLRAGTPEDIKSYLDMRRQQGQDVMAARNGVKTQAEREASLGHSEEVADRPQTTESEFHETPEPETVSERRAAEAQHEAEAKAQREKTAQDRAALPPTEGGIAGESKAGTFKVETVKRRSVTPPGKAKVLDAIKAKTEPKLEGKEGVARARLDVNTNPTEAQKRAGNYAKGHVKFEEHPVAIENPKGSERSGVDTNGEPWSHTMPTDYGYIKGTKGHDKDAVDAFIGPHGETGKAYVINQRDLSTGALDEHKVVFGTRSVAEAKALYDKSFGDGTGRARRHSIAEVTPDQLKHWLRHGDMNKPYAPHGSIWSAAGTHTFVPTHSTTLREMLPKLALQRRKDGSIQSYIARQLRHIVGDTPVHIVDESAISAMRYDTVGHYDPMHGHIVVRATGDAAKLTHRVLHEAVHAATWLKIYKSKRLQDTLRSIMDDIREETPNHYGMTNPHEFIAEAFGNEEFQNMLAASPISDALAAKLGLGADAKRTMWQAVTDFVRRIVGLQPHVHTALDAIMRVSERMKQGDFDAEHPHVESLRDRFVAHLKDVEEVRDTAHAQRTARQVVDDLVNRIDAAGRGKDLSHFMKTQAAQLMTGRQLYQMTRHKTGEVFSRAHEALNDAAARMDTRMKHLFAPAYDMARDVAAMSKKYMGEDWQNYLDLTDRAQRYNVHPDVGLGDAKNRHLDLSRENTKKGDEAAGAFINWQGRSKHAELAAQYKALPEELQKFWNRTQDFYAEQAKGAKDATLSKMLNGTDLPPEVKASAKAGKVMLDDTNEKYHGVLKATNNVHTAFKQTGPYAPSYRRGDWITHGELKYAKPTDGKLIDKHTYEFDTREAAHKYATSLDLPTSHKTAYYDSLTGERSTYEGAISREGEPIGKYHVKVNPRVFEAHETQRAAGAHRQEMLDSGKFADVQEVQKRNDTVDAGLEISTPQMQALIDNVRNYGSLGDNDRAEISKAISEAAVTMYPGNRFAKRMLGKGHTLGRDEDMARDFLDYGRSLSSYRAKGEFAPEINQHLETMRKDIDASRYHDSVTDKQEVFKSIKERLGHIDTGALGGDLNPIVRDAMLLTGLKRMASIGHVLIHMAHPFQMSLPVLASRHGMRAAGEIGRVYKDVSALDILKEGGAGFKRLISDPNARATNFLTTVRERLSNQKDGRDLNRMLDALVESGHIHPDNMFDFTKSTPEGNAAQRALYRVDNAFREISGAAEMVNRMVDAIAAYRLERSAGHSHAEAVKYAQDTVASTQGLYSAANRIPLAKSQLGRMAFQFKGYAQNVMALLAESMNTALHDVDPATRKEAWKRLAYVTATSGVLGGVVGLPLAMDMAKVALIMANAVGVTNYTYGTFEDDLQQKIASMVGGEGANVIMHGAGEAVGLNVGHRLGAGGLLFGEPSGYGAGDLMQYFAGNIFGAPTQAMFETAEGAKNVMEGKIYDGLAKISPIKQVEDTFKAIGLYAEGKQTKRGNQVAPPASLPAATLQAIGLQPSSIANAQAATAHMRERQLRDSKRRQELIERLAHPKGDLARTIQERVEWNRLHPDNRITDAHVANARKTKETTLGQQVNKRNKSEIETYKRAYGITP
ncbi:PLxRFG domain-containing protein [Methylocystis heyeri]|uniref:PLxRFG domain-containing protein n=1 Tax=Methylocystis heyeri TaxID=391905 RepID=A0A6B8KHZ6_9HYPH|nr:PLxRFG domain-containing protein [Methylocystis heyeri]QGM46133.1 PLxRFG domain-containing protein [Methylocystis heyeri]